MLKGVSPQDHSTDKYFKTEFLSASQATAFMYDEEIFHSRKKTVQLYPGWIPTDKKLQGLWRRYLLRLAHFGELRTIDGASREIDVSALHLSFLYAPAVKFLRYFQEDTQKKGESQAWEARRQHDDPARIHELYAQPNPKDDDLAYQLRRPSKIDRTTYDRPVDDYLHPYYDPVFSELPPGERFCYSRRNKKRQCN